MAAPLALPRCDALALIYFNLFYFDYFDLFCFDFV